MELLKYVFDGSIEVWKDAVKTAGIKDLSNQTIDRYCSSTHRAKLKEAIIAGKYKIKPPRIAKIPKDDGKFREVFINTDDDRVLLSVVNNALLDMFSDKIHTSCTSYQKGLSSQETVKETSMILREIKTDIVGVKADLTKYFDSVKRECIMEVFDMVRDRVGDDPLLDVVVDYYNNDTVIKNGKEITLYGSLKQGCAVASFLANVMLYDVDEKFSNRKGIYYKRYSDDLIMLGSTDPHVYINELKDGISKYGLDLNPKKIEILHRNEWFTFLGFSLQKGKISLSPRRLKVFEKTIDEMTLKSKYDGRRAFGNIKRRLFIGEKSWASSCFATINHDPDIAILNTYITDCLRACDLRNMKGKNEVWISKDNIGGIGFQKCNRKNTTLRGKGSKINLYRTMFPTLEYYTPLQHFINIYRMGEVVYKLENIQIEKRRIGKK